MTDQQPDLSKAINALAQLNTLAEAVAGYAAVLKNAGLPETAITHCVAEYHTFLIALLSKSMLGQQESLGEQLRKAAERMAREGKLR